MVVVDGRTDIEKLQELLATGTECSELDFKETLDLANKADELHFVKDAVSMFNRYPGGYIVIGATNDGKPSELCDGIDWKQFDGARLTDKVRGYAAAPYTVISALHEIDGHTYCLVCMQSLENGLPAPFTKLGQFQDENGKNKVVFRPGDITRRDGAQNRPIEYAQWTEILARHDAAIREDESRRINTLIDKITLALGEKGKTPPLVYGMDGNTLTTALSACLEQDETTKLIRFVNQIAMEFEHSDDAAEYLTAIATHALSYGNDEVYGRTVDALYDRYFSMNQAGFNADDTKMAILVSCYEIGASIVLAKRWDLISPFVNRVSPKYGQFYSFSSWIRDCQVAAINAGKYGRNGDGTLLSMVLEHIGNHAAIIPEYPTFARQENGKMSDAEEAVLDLLCGFDFLYCLCVFVVAGGDSEAYPSCVAFSEARVRSVEVKVFGSNDEVRRKLLPNNTDADIADGMRRLYYLISNEAMHSSRFVWGFDTAGVIRPFLDANPAPN